MTYTNTAKCTNMFNNEILRCITLQPWDEAVMDEMFSEGAYMDLNEAGGSTWLLKDSAGNEKTVHVDFLNDFEYLFDDDVQWGCPVIDAPHLWEVSNFSGQDQMVVETLQSSPKVRTWTTTGGYCLNQLSAVVSENASSLFKLKTAS